MNWPRLALITTVIFSGILLGLPWVTGADIEEWPDSLRWALALPLFGAMIVLGLDAKRRKQDEKRGEKQQDKATDDRRKPRFEQWIERRRQRFSPKRGLEYFVIGLVIFSLMAGINAVTRGVVSPTGALAFILGFSLIGGLVGMFTEDMPF